VESDGNGCQTAAGAQELGAGNPSSEQSGGRPRVTPSTPVLCLPWLSGAGKRRRPPGAPKKK